MRPARLFPTVLVASAFALAGCASVDVFSERYLGVPAVAPTAPASVEGLRTAPKRPHVQLGEVVASPKDDATTDEIELALKTEAARLGANAAVVVQDRMRRIGTSVSGTWWVRYHRPVYARQVVAVAIRYEGS